MSTTKRSSKKSPRSAKTSARATTKGPQAAEVALVFLVKRTPQAAEKIGKILGKSATEVEAIWRWCDGLDATAGENRKSIDRLEWVKETLGSEARASVSLDQDSRSSYRDRNQETHESHACASVVHDSSCCDDDDHYTSSLKPF